MRQADIARRLANMNRAPRCGARTRAGHSCEQAAVKGRARCRMHGGAKGSGGPRSDRVGNFKHGLSTRENVELRRTMGAKAQEIRGLFRAVNRRLK
jgi:ribosomal protein L32